LLWISTRAAKKNEVKKFERSAIGTPLSKSYGVRFAADPNKIVGGVVRNGVT